MCMCVLMGEYVYCAVLVKVRGQPAEVSSLLPHHVSLRDSTQGLRLGNM